MNPEVTEVSVAPGATAVVALGCTLLVARPLLVDSSAHPRTLLLVLFAGLALIGLLWPSPPPARSERPAPGVTLAVLTFGVATFTAARLLGGGHPPAAPTLAFVAMNSLAAVAEEAFFRRLVYGLLIGHGPGYAIAGSAVLFAAVHVTTYGYWVLPIDLGAGLVLGWQRWSSSSWLVPAVTHVAANVLVVI